MKSTRQHPLAFILWIFVCLLLLAPAALSLVPQWKGQPLYGVQESSEENAAFTGKNIFTGRFQKAADERVRRGVGISNAWIRFHHELNYRIFNYTSAEKLVLGSDGCFYEEMYITEYLGRNYIGDFFIEKKVRELKQLQQVLRDEYGVDLLLVFEPGKAHFHPEGIPERYHPEIKGKTNYEGFTAECRRAGVRYLDLNAYFSDLKAKSPHPLYSKYGVHWSTYGLWKATDTLVGFIENQCCINLPDIIAVGDSSSRFNKDLDFDMEPSMNLLCGLPHETLNFPIRRFEYDGTCHVRPRVLTIADSYYWSIVNSGISDNLFATNEFWYYNEAVYPDIWNPVVWADKSDLCSTFRHHDIILLMITDANLYNFGWGFIEEALAAVVPDWRPDPSVEALDCIMQTKEEGQHKWYLELLKRATRMQRPFSQVLRDEVEGIKRK
ncbi:MAG: hypothetical protein II757_01435 [Bacteroidales bacterium]|nr:hypothetical protein [Bacteroidales bacterium]